jgi:hypothetical protein
MARWRFERGDVPIGCLVGLVVLLVVALVAIKAAPLIVNVGELDKEIETLADRANRRDYNDERIVRDILAKAENLDLPVTAKDITIKRTSSRIKITVAYDIPVEFPGYNYVWHKQHYQDRPLIEI